MFWHCIVAKLSRRALIQTLRMCKLVSMNSTQKEIDDALAVLGAARERFAGLSTNERRLLIVDCIPKVVSVAEEWIAAGCQAKGSCCTPAIAAEEILNGPAVTLRFLQLTSAALADLEKGQPPCLPGRFKQDRHGRLQVPVFPTRGLFDRLNFFGFNAHVRMLPKVNSETFEASRSRGEFVPTESCVALVLGAGNVSSIPIVDTLTKLFHENQVVLLKMNPVNAYLGPIMERAFCPLIAEGFLRIIYGDGTVGAAAVGHRLVDRVHVTGSIETHDTIVWGPVGADRERRKRDGRPLLGKPITSELGNVSPWIVVPGKYSQRQLEFQAENIAASITNNASFNCVATKLIVTCQYWPDRERFLDLIQKHLDQTPKRHAYYPGAAERHRRFSSHPSMAACARTAEPPSNECVLPWTLLRDVDLKEYAHLAQEESFVCVCAETSLAADTPQEFLRKAVRFVNDEVWGTLCVALTLPNEFRRVVECEQCLEDAVAELNYGAVSVNHWPALVYALMSPPWGGFPGSTLSDIQSGCGWVHNTYMLKGVEKTVLQGPLRIFPKPVWFPTHSHPDRVARRMLALYTKPTLFRWLALAAQSIIG